MMSVHWRSNPTFRLSLSKRPAVTLWRVHINLSLLDKRASRSQEEDLLAVPVKYEPFALTVLADDPLLDEVVDVLTFDVREIDSNTFKKISYQIFTIEVSYEYLLDAMIANLLPYTS